MVTAQENLALKKPVRARQRLCPSELRLRRSMVPHTYNQTQKDFHTARGLKKEAVKEQVRQRKKGGEYLQSQDARGKKERAGRRPGEPKKLPTYGTTGRGRGRRRRERRQ